MDPFSITVGAIGLAGAANTATGSVIKRLKALRNAPEELQDLLAELSQFEDIFQAIQDASHASEHPHSLLETLLDTAKDKILELNSLVEYRLTKAGTSSEVDRSQWAGSQKDVDRLRKQLTNIRANLHVKLSSSTNTTVENTWGLLRQVHADNYAMRQLAATFLPQILQDVQSTGSAVTDILNNFPRITLESSRSDLQSAPDTAHNSVTKTNRSDTYGGSIYQLQPRKTHIGPHCRLDCACECHRTYYSSTPWPLARFCGNVYVEGKGSSGVGASHHIKSCKASAVSQIRVIYFVPTWFAMKAYEIRYTSTPLHGPEWLIRVPRIVHQYKNRGSKAIDRGDINMFRLAIASGECTPYDIYEDGTSMIEKVVLYERIDLMAHLVGMGVDICQLVGTDTSLLTYLWVLLSGGSLRFRPDFEDFESLPKLIPSFPFDDYSESNGFTLLHEIVCHFNGRDLDSALQTHSADVNKLSKSGDSPLQIAVRLGNIAAIRTLLKRGADPNVNNGAPLSEALGGASLVIVDLLLRSDATLHGPTGDQTAQTWFNDDQSYIWNAAERLAIDRILIEYGIDINRQVWGRTKLMALCQEQELRWADEGTDRIYTDRIEQLIGLGADLELRDPKGYTALHCAVCADNRVAIKTLLHFGARSDVKTNEGDTIAHLAMICSRKIESAKVMFEMDLGRLDLNLKTEDGHTVYDLLRKRNGLGWEAYYSEWRESRAQGSQDYWFWVREDSRSYYCDEYEVILALEALLHHIQDLQGVPKDQQYPPLGEYLSDGKDEDPVPGAWPL